MSASPDDGGWRPVSTPMAVVLPAPFWPSSAVTWSSNISRDKSLNAITGFDASPLNLRHRFRNAIATFAPADESLGVGDICTSTPAGTDAGKR